MAKHAVIHILNGDALREQFPASVEGELIVARECLVVGDVSGNDLKDFYENRAKDLLKSYGTPISEYFSKVVPEYEKIRKLRVNSTVNLWFEDDLFCQVNLWFCCPPINQIQYT